MANVSRQYAEGLVGPLDNSSYQTQRDVSQNTYNTNWQALQNQYKVLQEKLKQQQDTANKDYANGLANVIDNSFSRSKDVNTNLVNRGLTASGVKDVKQQAETAQKGSDVLKLLDKVGSSAVDTTNQLSSANSSLASKEANLNNSLGNTLGNIGAKDVSSQLNYNKVLANIAGAKDTRDANNKLAAEQRAINAAAMAASSSTNKAKEALNNFYKKAAINEVLSSGNMSDTDKKSTLATLFGVINSNDVVDAFNSDAHATENYNNQIDALNKVINNTDTSKITSDILKNATPEQKLLNSLLQNGEGKVYDRSGGAAQKLVNYLSEAYQSQSNNTSPAISKQDALDALNKITGPTGDIMYNNGNKNVYGNNISATLDNLINTYNNYKNGTTPLLNQQISSGITSSKANAQSALDALQQKGITYADLASLLYGSN